MELLLFNKDEFFSNKRNLKIEILYKLYEKGKLKIIYDNEYLESLCEQLDCIRKSLQECITINKLKEFMENDESIIIQRLSLIRLIIDKYEPKEEYYKLKKKINEIEEVVNEFKYISDNIILYLPKAFKFDIKELSEEIARYDKMNLYRIDFQKIRERLLKLKPTAEKIDEVKNFLLFNIIYDINNDKDEIKKFDSAYKTLENIGFMLRNGKSFDELNNSYKKLFDLVREKIVNNRESNREIYFLIKNFKNYYNINDQLFVEDLAIFLSTKKYEIDINSIIFFFKFFEKDNNNWNKLIEKYENLSKNNFKDIKKLLDELRNKNIYDFRNIQYYNIFFLSLYQKNEAIDFLFKSTCEDVDILKAKIQNNNFKISVKDLENTKQCIKTINQMKKLNDNFKIFNYIKMMNMTIIKNFDDYSRIYSSIIELTK